MTNEIKEILDDEKVIIDQHWNYIIIGNEKYYELPKRLLDYITNLQEENERLNKNINKIKKLRNANTHIEDIYYAEGILFNEPYCDIEDVDNEELLDILRGDE